MRTHPNGWPGVAAAGAVLAGALYVGCTVLAQSSWSGGASEAERQERLTADFDSMARRQATIRYLAGAVVEGNLSLREAAEDVRAEDINGPPHLRMHVEYLPGRTEEERYCRSLLRHVRGLLAGDARAPSALARAEGELEDVVRGRPAPPRRARATWHPRVPQPPEVLTRAPAPEQAGRGEAH
jgi:hypothetical protein